MKPWLSYYCILAGVCDASTGALLLGAPDRVTALLRLEPAPPPAYAAFIGAFVLAVGLSYLYPFLLAAEERAARCRVVFETTAISRLAVASFLAAAIASGALGASWAAVLATDLALGGFQAAWLWRTRKAAP